MSQQTKQTSISTPVDLPIKRKRGRPRKDENHVKKPNSDLNSNPSMNFNSNSSVNPIASDGIRKNIPIKVSPSDDIDDSMVGRAVSGVIEGTFDAGYFISVRLNSGTHLRGVVFQPGRFVPITAANDVAPQAKMFRRKEFPIPVCSPQSQANGFNPQAQQSIKQPVHLETHIAPKQSLPSPMRSGSLFVVENQSASVIVPMNDMPKSDSGAPLGGKILQQQNFDVGLQNQSAPPLENLKMVEQDEVMQVFEASVMSQPKSELEASKNVISEPASGSMFSILPSNETTKQVSQVLKQPVEPIPEPRNLVYSELKGPNLQLQPNPLVARSQMVEPKESVHFELQSPNLELHETAVAISQSIPLGPQLEEHGLEASATMQNEPKSPELEAQQTPATAISESQSMKSGNPSVNFQGNMNCPNSENEQSHVVAMPQTVPLESQSVKFPKPSELAYNQLNGHCQDSAVDKTEPMLPTPSNEVPNIVIPNPLSPKNSVPEDMDVESVAKELKDEASCDKKIVIDTAGKFEAASSLAPVGT